MYFHWLIVGTPVHLVDDLVSALRKYECYFNQNESEWHPYNILIRDSEPAQTLSEKTYNVTAPSVIQGSEPAQTRKPWWKFWD